MLCNLHNHVANELTVILRLFARKLIDKMLRLIANHPTSTLFFIPKKEMKKKDKSNKAT